MSRIKSSDGRDDDNIFSGFWYEGTKHFSFVRKLVLCTCRCSEVSQHSKPKTPLVLTIRETRQSLSKQMVSSSILGLTYCSNMSRAFNRFLICCVTSKGHGMSNSVYSSNKFGGCENTRRATHIVPGNARSATIPCRNQFKCWSLPIYGKQSGLAFQWVNKVGTITKTRPKFSSYSFLIHLSLLSRTYKLPWVKHNSTTYHTPSSQQ